MSRWPRVVGHEDDRVRRGPRRALLPPRACVRTSRSWGRARTRAAPRELPWRSCGGPWRRRSSRWRASSPPWGAQLGALGAQLAATGLQAIGELGHAFAQLGHPLAQLGHVSRSRSSGTRLLMSVVRALPCRMARSILPSPMNTGTPIRGDGFSPSVVSASSRGSRRSGRGSPLHRADPERRSDRPQPAARPAPE